MLPIELGLFLLIAEFTGVVFGPVLLVLDLRLFAYAFFVVFGGSAL